MDAEEALDWHARGSSVSAAVGTALLALAIALGGLPAGFARAELTGVATLATTAPDSAELFTRIELLSARSTRGVIRGATDARLGLYEFSSTGTLTRIADTSSTIPGTALTFSHFSGSARVGDAGLIAFRGEGAEHSGIFRAQGGVVAVVADTTMVLPGTEGMLFTSFDRAVGAGASQVSFRASSDGREGIYLWNAGVLAVVADTTTLVPGGGGAVFSAFSAPVVTGSRVAFRARAPELEGIYVYESGSLTLVADTATVVPGDAVTFTGFDARIALSAASVAFLGSASEREGIYRLTGSGLAAVLETGQATPGGFVATDLLPPVAADDEQVAFRADGLSASAILRLSAGTLAQIAAVGAPIAGGPSTITGLTRLAASGGTVSFRGSGQDYEAVYFRDATGLRAVADVNTAIPATATSFGAFDEILALDASAVLEGRGAEALGVFQSAVPASVAIPAGAGPVATIGAGLGTVGGGTISLPATSGGTFSSEFLAVAAAGLEAATGIDPGTLPFSPASEPIQVWTIVYDGSVGASPELQLTYDAAGVGDETRLRLYRFDGVAWTLLTGSVEATQNRISVATVGFGIFVLATAPTPVPLVDPRWVALILLLTLSAAMAHSRKSVSHTTGGES
jgi:hypothetical protein